MLRKNNPYAVEQAFPKNHKAAVLEYHEMQLLADSLEPTVVAAVVPLIPPFPSISSERFWILYSRIGPTSKQKTS